MASLKRLDVRGNDLREAPLAFLQAQRKRDGFSSILRVSHNRLQRPPQTVMDMGVDDAISWWKDIERSGEGISNKLKLVLVGLAEAGKTTVVRNITGRTVTKSLDRTVGIEITDGWTPVGGGSLKVSIWDFAGQADYYASHQIFLTKGSLFLLVVDLHALFVEVTSGADKDGDPRGRVYRWLEMMHLRVPGAAVAIVGTHCDAAVFKANPAKLDKTVKRMEKLIDRYHEDKREAAKEDNGRRTVFVESPRPLFIHDKIFRTSLEHDSTNKLEEWIAKAASHLDCPPEFHFPAVGARIPQVWINANSAMDDLKARGPGKLYVTWREAVKTFDDFMDNKGTPVSDPEEILLRAMRHREAEGGVLLYLEHDPPRLGGSTGMLYLDPTWLIEVIRRLTDHNLVDPANQDTIRIELEGHRKELLKRNSEKRLPCPTREMLWDQHRSYRRSGTLDVAYLRFLWLHRHLDSTLKLHLNHDEFNIVLKTMENQLVLYRVPSAEGTDHGRFVVLARLPELGDEHVLEKANMALGDVIVRTTCSFRQSYAPPGVIGRFLAFANVHVKEARECWQHGAHLIWTPGNHDVLVYETHSVECSGGTSVAYPGLVLCVKGSSPAARDVLDDLKDEVRKLFVDKVHGYPGLCFGGFGDTDLARVSDLIGDLRNLLDSRFQKLDALVGRVAEVTSGVLEAFYLTTEKDNKYPRLLTLKPESNLPRGAVPAPRTTPGPSTTVRSTCENEGNRAAAADWMQRETWNRMIKALTEGRKCRMVFICEHDMTEVRCGPGGAGYHIEELAGWVKDCLPLLQVSLYALRVAVGMVSHVDLPLNDVLAALAKSASTELLGVMATSFPVLGLTEATPLPNESTGVGVLPMKLQEEGYEALCRFMRGVEDPSTSCCGLRRHCSYGRCTKRNDDACVSWREEMVRVRNGKGGVVWVKKTNEAAYKEKLKQEVGMSRTSPHGKLALARV